MTTTTDVRETAPAPDPGGLRHGQLSRAQHFGIVAAAIVLGALSWLIDGASPNWARWLIVSVLAYVALIYGIARAVEGKREATDRAMVAIVTCSFLIVAIPLVSVVWTVLSEGLTRFDVTFFTETMRGIVGEGGGVYHAIIGTVLVTGLTALISVPFGVFTAIYLVE
ncbi:MAG: phosphate ABC transporter, permease protein PstA, partial [Actinomycetota bacterium]